MKPIDSLNKRNFMKNSWRYGILAAFEFYTQGYKISLYDFIKTNFRFIYTIPVDESLPPHEFSRIFRVTSFIFFTRCATTAARIFIPVQGYKYPVSHFRERADYSYKRGLRRGISYDKSRATTRTKLVQKSEKGEGVKRMELARDLYLKLD